MAKDDTFGRGRAKLRDVHGERSLETIEALGDLGKMIIEVAYGDIYSRPGLSLRDRQIATVAVLTALGRSSQLPIHLRASLSAGVTVEELREVILQTAVLAGFPPAMNAWSTLKTIAPDAAKDGA